MKNGDFPKFFVSLPVSLLPRLWKIGGYQISVAISYYLGQPPQFINQGYI